MRRAWGFSFLLLAIPLFASAQSTCPSLSLGVSGTQVTAVQKILHAAYSNFPNPTGYFGPLTQAALKQWQTEHGILSTGTVGPVTATAMNICNTFPSSGSSPAAHTVSHTASYTSASTASAPTTISSVSHFSFGSTGADVLSLQKFLITQGLLSADSATGYFGPLTQAAFLNWQVRTAIANASAPPTSVQSVIPLPAGATTTVSWALAPCTLNGKTLQTGESATFYAAPTAGGACASQNRACLNGALDGSSQYQYTSCTGSGGGATIGSSAFTTGAQCSFNGTPVIDSTSFTAYQSPVVPTGASCVSEQRRCSNGVLSGSFQFQSCNVAAAQSCILDGQLLTTGSSQTFYSARTVSPGSSCASVAAPRTCTAGTLSGDASYQYASCTTAAASCTFGGQTISSGSSVIAFQTASVSSGGTCNSQTRTCTAGVLGGDGSYQSSTCYVASQNAPAPNVFVQSSSNGSSIELPAWFATPGGAGPYPAIVLAHGCNGLNADDPSSAWQQMSNWASTFRQWGYATLILDSYTSRGWSNICSNVNVFSPTDRAIDFYSAAATLAKTAAVSPQEVGLFGDSQAGASFVQALDNSAYGLGNARSALASAGGKIGAAALLYPVCSDITGHTFSAPLFIAAGSADTWTSPATCESLTNFPAASSTPVDVSGFGALVRIIVYPNATHAFDVNAPDRTTSLGYYLHYDARATADVQARIQNFFDTYVR